MAGNRSRRGRDRDRGRNSAEQKEENGADKGRFWCFHGAIRASSFSSTPADGREAAVVRSYIHCQGHVSFHQSFFVLKKRGDISFSPLIQTSFLFEIWRRFEVEGYVSSFGNPDWQRTHEPAEKTAYAVTALLKAGAKCVGKTVMDEFGFG